MKTLCLYLFAAVPGLFVAQPNCGFPGDTNNDGRADFLDLLPIGLRYGAVFEPRPDWSTDWFLQCFEPWPNGLPATGINTGFSDTDGNGVVDSLDAEIIVFNYDSLHNAPSVPPPLPYLPPLNPAIPCAGLSYAFREDPDDPRRFYADVFFEAPPTFPGALAAALRLTYDPAFVIDDSTRVLFDPSDADLMGVGAAFRSTTLQRQLPSGTVEMAVSGRGSQALVVPRRIGIVSFIITEDVIIRNDTVPFTLAFDQSLIITLLEEAVCHSVQTDTLLLVRLATTAAEKPSFRLFPNPVTGVLQLDAPESFQAYGITVYNATGAPVRSAKGHVRSLDLSGLTPGWHLVEIHGNEGVFRQKILVR